MVIRFLSLRKAALFPLERGAVNPKGFLTIWVLALQYFIPSRPTMGLLRVWAQSGVAGGGCPGRKWGGPALLCQASY